MKIFSSSEINPEEIWVSSRVAVLNSGKISTCSVNTQGVVKQPTPENSSKPVSMQGAASNFIPENPFIAVSSQGAASYFKPENPFTAVSMQGAAYLFPKPNPENPFTAVSTQAAAFQKPATVSTKDVVHLSPLSYSNNTTKNFNDENKNKNHLKIKKDSMGITKIQKKIKKIALQLPIPTKK